MRKNRGSAEIETLLVMAVIFIVGAVVRYSFFRQEETPSIKVELASDGNFLESSSTWRLIGEEVRQISPTLQKRVWILELKLPDGSTNPQVISEMETPPDPKAIAYRGECLGWQKTIKFTPIYPVSTPSIEVEKK